MSTVLYNRNALIDDTTAAGSYFQTDSSTST